MSLRQQIVDAIETRAKTISVANGYQTAIGSHVFVWKLTPFGANEMPGVDIRDRSDAIDSEGLKGSVNVDNHDLTVAFEVVCQSGRTSDDDVRKMIADVYKMIGMDPTWGSLALTTQLAGDEITETQDEHVIAGATITVTVLYRTNKYAS
jgi:hypothetical protein